MSDFPSGALFVLLVGTVVAAMFAGSPVAVDTPDLTQQDEEEPGFFDFLDPVLEPINKVWDFVVFLGMFAFFNVEGFPWWLNLLLIKPLVAVIIAHMVNVIRGR